MFNQTVFYNIFVEEQPESSHEVNPTLLKDSVIIHQALFFWVRGFILFYF